MMSRKKKVLAISSTPRRGGNSDVLCDHFLNGARESGHDVEKIFLKDMKVKYCTACGTCYDITKECPLKDDASVIVQKMKDADVIVMATPVYFYSMSAQMKTLIDRTCCGYRDINRKDFYFIATAADDSPESLERTFEGFRAFTSCLMEPQEKGLIRGIGLFEVGDVRNRPILDQAYGMGRDV